MALVWQCDRCGRMNNGGDIDDPPEEWRQVTMPVRGSKGARSTTEAVICGDCDDALYRWWTRAGEPDA